MTEDRSRFLNFTSTVVKVKVPGGGTIEAQGFWEIHIKLNKQCGGRDIKLQKALYVPNLGWNIISEMQITNAINMVISTQKQARVYDKYGNFLLRAIKSGNLKCVFEEFQAEKANKLTPGTALLGATVDDKQKKYIKKWHRRYGHFNCHKLREVRKFDEEGALNFKCEVCMAGKMTAHPYPKVTLNRAIKPLELVHCDLLCVLSPETIRGEKSALSIVDDYSRMGATYLLRTKDQSFEKYQEFKAMTENYHESQIKTIRTDRGGEFVSTEFDEHLKMTGVQR